MACLPKFLSLTTRLKGAYPFTSVTITESSWHLPLNSNVRFGMGSGHDPRSRAASPQKSTKVTLRSVLQWQKSVVAHDPSIPSPTKDSKGASNSASDCRTTSIPSCLPPSAAGPLREPIAIERNPESLGRSRANPGPAALVPRMSMLCRKARIGGGGGDAGQKGSVPGLTRASNSVVHDAGLTSGLSVNAIDSGQADPPHQTLARPGTRPRRSRSERRQPDRFSREISGCMFMASA
mmetsp:Transcript_39278/g.72505  ORF Transcript_39278/g.72505 Transcript_39278/m.72505 type:complete len:236 (-) Transcript_39278:942-1649(-)